MRAREAELEEQARLEAARRAEADKAAAEKEEAERRRRLQEAADEEAEKERKREEAERKRREAEANVGDFEKALTKWGLKRDAEGIELSNKGIKDDDCNLLAAIIRENKNLKRLYLSEYEWNHSQLSALN